MEASPGHPVLRPGRLNTHTAYGIGLSAAWAVLLATCAAAVWDKALGSIVAISGGSVTGWTSATIARPR